MSDVQPSQPDKAAGRPGERADGRPDEVSSEFRCAVELVGRRWCGAVVRALLDHPHYFAELGHAIPGVSDRLLSRRLRELEAEGLVEREVLPGAPARVRYSLTDKGRAMGPALHELEAWGRRWNGDGAPRVPGPPKGSPGDDARLNGRG